MKFLRWPLLALVLACGTTAAYAQSTGTKAPARPSAATRAAAPRPAASGDLDGIAAVVNDDVVLRSDVEEQLYLFLMRVGQRPDTAMLDTLRGQILERLIDEKLIVAEAKRQGVTAAPAEVEKQVEQAMREAKQRMGGEDGYRAQLARENLTEEGLRERYRTELTRTMVAQRLVQRQIPRKPVTAAEAEAYFKAHPDEFPKVPAELKLSVIQIPAMPDSVVDQRARARIMEVRRRLTAGERFAKVAAEASEDPSSAQSGGDLGFFRAGTLDPNLEEAAARLEPGELSPPVRTAFGWHVVEVIERDTVRAGGRDSLDASGRPVIETHARHIMVRVPITEADAERAHKLAEKALAEARKGTPFADLVRKYSKYQGPAGPDGDLGFLSLGSLSPQIRAGLADLEPGDISEVLANPAGFNIFKVTDRRPERAYTLEEIRDELPEAVGEIRQRQKYDEWVKGLRAKAVIDVRS